MESSETDLSGDGRRARSDVDGTSRKLGEVLNVRGGGACRFGAFDDDAEPVAFAGMPPLR